ncbi:hypothetical protein Dsin_015255 [Dipteronia sinensis]|uniref:Uncharacterized protein n=1 Tax=Dipteronia sinensis TaxID=43782 RepID=A0AAE0AAY1_9ROSI|nr:hypothetical protein Dsin_015255 [Dipteronia sinensis]
MVSNSMDRISMEASLYVTSSAGSSVVPSRPRVSLRPHGGEAVDGFADPLLGSSSLSIRGSLPRCEDVVGVLDLLVGGSLPMSSIRGSSFADLFKVTPIQVDNVSCPSILSKKGGYLAVWVDPFAYKCRLEVCKGYFQIMLNSDAEKNMVWSLGSLNLKPAKGIGVPLRLDRATMEGDFGHFARVLMDIDVSTVPPSSLLLERDDSHSFFISAEYVNLPTFYSTCSSIGHFPNACR